MGTRSDLRFETLFRRTLGSEVVMILLLSGLRWALYATYLAHHCEGPPLQAHWKHVAFCATSGELQLWQAVDYALIGFVGLFILTALAATLLAWRRTSP
jgi:hypothetical protein